MALRLFIIFALTSISALAETFTSLEKLSPEIALCIEEDIYQACAADLCGPPNKLQSIYLQDQTFERFLSKEGLASLPKVKENLQKVLEQKLIENQKVIDELKKKKAAGTLLPSFHTLNDTQWDELAVAIYQTHLGYNPYNPPEGPVLSRTPVTDVVTKGLQDFAQKETSCASKACREGVKSYLSEDLYGRKLEELSLKASNSKLIADRLPYCVSAYAQTALKKNQQAKIQAGLPNFFEQYITKALSGYSAHSKAVFRKFLKEKLVIKYEAPGQTSADFLNQVKELSEKTKPKKSDLEQMLFYREGKSSMDPLSELRYICPSSYSSAGGDAFLPQEGDDEATPTLFISLASQLDPVNGEGILYHELSHVLSHVFGSGEMSTASTAEFKKLRECVKSLSPLDPAGANNVVVSHEGDHKCTEEDAADVTSYKAVGIKAGPLMECSLLKPTADRTAYEKLDMNEKNSHSAKLVRILREAIHRDRTLPASCQKVIEQNKAKLTFKKCF